MRKIADISSYLFIVAVTVLSVVSILGIWQFFSHDVISKSFQSIGLLGLVALIVIIAERFIDRQKVGNDTPGSNPPAPMSTMASPIPSTSGFTVVRHFTLAILIISVALFALFGVLAIWEVITGDAVSKSLTSIAIAAFSSFIIVLTCLIRENKLTKRGNPDASITGIVISLILLWWMISIFF